MRNPFGRVNPHCSNCGDERGGPFGHEISECKYRHGMTVLELTKTMDDSIAQKLWEQAVEEYFEEALKT